MISTTPIILGDELDCVEQVNKLRAKSSKKKKKALLENTTPEHMGFQVKTEPPNLT